MPATPFDTSGKSAALIQGADSLRRAGIHFTSPHLFAGIKGVGERPLWCGFRTQVRHRVTSEKCQLRTLAPQPTAFLFHHLVGAGEQRRRHAKAERLCSLEVDYQLELGWQHDRQVCRLGPGEKAARIGSSLTIGLEDGSTVAD